MNELLLRTEINKAYFLITNETKDFPNLDLAVETILSKDFNEEINIETVLDAIKIGSTGDFGYTKKLTIQIMLMWIKSHNMSVFLNKHRAKGY